MAEYTTSIGSLAANTVEVYTTNFKDITEEEFAALADVQKVSKEQEQELYNGDVVYIDSSWSREINANLVKEKVGSKIPDTFMDAETRKAIKVLDAVIAANKTKDNLRVHRYVSDYWLTEGGEQKKVGMVFKEPRFTSTSAIGRKNYLSRKNVHITIEIPRGTHAFVTRNYDESEIILPRNSSFFVKSMERRNGKQELVLQIL